MLYEPASYEHRVALGTALVERLLECEFVEDSSATAKERVFIRRVQDEIYVAVYTSVVGNAVRAKDADAIRVVGLYRTGNSERGLFKNTRVYRTGEIEEIVERMVERMRTTWRRCSNVERCYRCGAPKFEAKTGKMVCAAICWEKK